MVLQPFRTLTETFQSGGTELQFVDFLGRRRFRHGFDLDIADQAGMPLQARQQAGRKHFGAGRGHAVGRQQHQAAFADAGRLKIRVQVSRQFLFDQAVYLLPGLRALQQEFQLRRGIGMVAPPAAFTYFFQIHFFRRPFVCIVD